MNRILRKKYLVFFFATICICLIIIYKSYKKPSLNSATLSSLYTSGNQILQKDTGKAIVLQGVTSDYFRYGFNYEYPKNYGGLEKELQRLKLLKEKGTGVNMVGLYFSRKDLLEKNIEELDRYIQYAKEHGLYIFLAPGGVGFIESNPKKVLMKENYWSHVGPHDLVDLTTLLATRYGHESNILFQLVAEPNMDHKEWSVLQEKLATIVRQHSNNPIILSTSYYSTYDPLPTLPTFKNIIYSSGGYIRKDDTSPKERTVEEIAGNEHLIKNYPVIVAEFGGNYGENFSTPDDLLLLSQILKTIFNNKMSYSLYRLSSAYEHDGLAIFDTSNNLTKKGEVFVKWFR